jgi:uncharacterized protein YbjT (DUF2867 family)
MFAKEFTRFIHRFLVIAVTCVATFCTANGDNAEMPGSEPAGNLVLVAGATGRTGNHVVGELLAHGYRVRAFVRDVDEAREKLGADIDYAVGDVRQRETIDAALDGATAIISAIGAGREDPSNGPEFVDYGGTKNLVEAAADAGLEHFVVISSAGVTHEDHVLNKMFNNVLIWKFKGEEVVRNSGVTYTIIRPGGLTDKAGGEKEVVFEQGDNASGLIPRADLARVCVAALIYPEAQNRTFELVGGDGPFADDLQSQFSGLDGD